MQAIFRAAAWLLVMVIMVLSVVPPSHRPMTNAWHGLEHISIFLATGVAFGIGYPNRVRVLAPALVIFVSAIEIAQLWVPGRHARLSDFLLDAVGVSIGLGMAWLHNIGRHTQYLNGPLNRAGP
jgi:VanZ family protein